jgi:hypothetical protein|tara:strand:- start:16178 stop:16846 length:669 start_codon:yes stop_codon:yes gene_type:complete
MEEYIIKENKLSIPSSWEDCSFDKFLRFANLLEGISAKEESEPKTEVEEWEATLQDLKDNTKILSFWLQLTESEVSLIDLDVANDIMKTLSFLNEHYTPINIDSFSIGDEKFILPENFMKQSSFGRYVEAEQLELQSNMLDKGKMEILPRQIAILCKKEGEVEKLDDDLIDKRAKQFEKLDMATIWDVGFFLSKLEQKLMLSFLTSQVKEEIQRPELQQEEQ